jgi:hypothetical protein
MEQQNIKTHKRFVPGYHFIASIAILLLIAGSIINLSHSAPENLYSASLLLVSSCVLLLLWFYLRAFALKAQDRAIRAEENFRHFVLTGKPLSKGVSTRQIIALRFASDEEFVALAIKAEKENLSSGAIKQAIVNWKPDTYRV